MLINEQKRWKNDTENMHTDDFVPSPISISLVCYLIVFTCFVLVLVLCLGEFPDRHFSVL